MPAKSDETSKASKGELIIQSINSVFMINIFADFIHTSFCQFLLIFSVSAKFGYFHLILFMYFSKFFNFVYLSPNFFSSDAKSSVKDAGKDAGKAAVGKNTAKDTGEDATKRKPKTAKVYDQHQMSLRTNRNYFQQPTRNIAKKDALNDTTVA